jgi:hypothetical protein
MLDTAHGCSRFREVMVRIYAPEDFLTLWRYRFAKWLGFSWIPGAECPFPMERTQSGRIANGEELQAWMKQNGVTQAQLAKRARMRRQTISENLRRMTSRAKFWDKINKAIQSWA